jgi:cell division protein FtsB
MRRKRESAKRLTWLTEAQAALGWGIILVLVAVLGTIYLSQASQIAVTGRRVQIRQNELDTLKRENAAMEKDIAEAQALDRLRSRAQAMGFVSAQPGDIEYLLVPDYPRETAVPPSLIPPAANVIPETPVPPETMQEALWAAFRSSVNSLIEGEAGEQ